jgi:hypothetical protein
MKRDAGHRVGQLADQPVPLGGVVVDGDEEGEPLGARKAPPQRPKGFGATGVVT